MSREIQHFHGRNLPFSSETRPCFGLFWAVFVCFCLFWTEFGLTGFDLQDGGLQVLIRRRAPENSQRQVRFSISFRLFSDRFRPFLSCLRLIVDDILGAQRLLCADLVPARGDRGGEGGVLRGDRTEQCRDGRGRCAECNLLLDFSLFCDCFFTVLRLVCD